MNNSMPTKCDNSGETDLFLERAKLPKMTQEKNKM